MVRYFANETGTWVANETGNLVANSFNKQQRLVDTKVHSFQCKINNPPKKKERDSL